MRAKLYYLEFLLISVSLFAFASRSSAQVLDMSKTVSNITTGGSGASAVQGNILEYTIFARNLLPTPLTNAVLYDNIPAGCAYVAGSTTMNGLAVADVSGNMPFNSGGGPIRSAGQALGTIGPSAIATIKFRVRVTANGGNVTNFAIGEAKYSGNDVIKSTNTVITNLTPDASCFTVYQSTTVSQNGTPQTNGDRYKYIKTLNTSNGTGGPILYDGSTGPCFNALTGAALAAGSIMTYTSAIAYDKSSNRIYFVNNSTASVQDLSYVDLSASPICAKKYIGYPLETTVGTGWNINRMGFASDGMGYAITESGSDLIRFYINAVGIPVITRLGPLINDAINGGNDVLSEVGGDIFGDGSGNLYLIANSSKLYKINPNTRITTFLGSVNPFPAGASNSIAINPAGNVYYGGAYQNVYTVSLATMGASSITGGSTSNVWTSGDYTSCGFPVLAPNLIANKTWTNINACAGGVVGGDTVEYKIEIINNGNINAAGVKMYDAIPATTTYVPNSTKLNGVAVPDVTGNMPYAITGGAFVNTPGELPGIIKVGNANKAVVTFRAKTSPLNLVCNTSKISVLDVFGNNLFIVSADPSQSGQNATCFFSTGVLPLENIKFKGSLLNDKSLLQWDVSAEPNIERYELEYSDDGSNFTLVGTIPSQGNSAANSYQFTDNDHVVSEVRYYRLKIWNNRGNSSYSGIIRLSSKGLRVIRVQPNPFDKNINIQFQLKNSETVLIRLIDFHGREVLRTSETYSAGSQSVSLNVPILLSRGLYILEINTGDDNIYRQKLLKQ